MNGSLLKVSLILSVALPLSLGALPGQINQPTSAQQKPPVQETPDHYKLGYEYGKKLIYLLSQPNSAEVMNQAVLDKEVLRLTNIINKENPSTEAHKKAFKEYQTYNKGLKEALATYVPSKGTDMESLGKNYAIKINQDMADVICKAPDMATARTEISALVTKAANDAQRLVPALPKVSFTLDIQHPNYKEGYALGKQSREWFVVEAQGKTVPEEEQIAMQKRINNFMFTSQQGKSQEEIIKGSLQFFSGYKKALEEFNLEEALITHKTPKEQAEKLRIGFKFALQSMSGALDSLQNPDKGFGSVGKAFEDCAQDMNKVQKA